MWPNPQETADLVIFTDEILHGNLYSFVQCNMYSSKLSLKVAPGQIQGSASSCVWVLNYLDFKKKWLSYIPPQSFCFGFNVKPDLTWAMEEMLYMPAWK